jgi:Fe-S cluster assembly scaffold protein SufB
MDTSLCILKGFAKIANGATMSSSYIKERSILLDKGTRVDSLPDMSVDENDVKAAHSSATAPISEDEMFYLMSKGIDAIQAKRLIVNGFFSEYTKAIGNGAMNEVTGAMINEKFEKRKAMP